MEKKKYTEAQKRAIYKYREKNKEKTSELVANWKAKNANYLKEYAKSYYEKNREKILQCRKKRYVNHQNCTPKSSLNTSDIIL